jgi:hypothetical protein
VATPDHLFGGDHVADLKVLDLAAHFDDLARELVAQDSGELGQARVEDIVLVIGLVEVHVRATYSAGLDLDEHLVWLDSGFLHFPDLELRVAPDSVAGDGLTRRLLEL